MFGLFRSKEEKFWAWISKNSVSLAANGSFEIEKGKELIKAVNEELDYFIKPNGAKPQLIITAGGTSSAFPAVEKLAGQYSGNEFTVVKFMPRDEKINEITVGNIKLLLNEVFFTLSKSSDKLGVTVYVKNYNSDNLEIQDAVYKVLSCELGEYNLETKIGFIDMVNLPENYLEKKLLNIKKLHEFVR